MNPQEVASGLAVRAGLAVHAQIRKEDVFPTLVFVVHAFCLYNTSLRSFDLTVDERGVGALPDALRDMGLRSGYTGLKEYVGKDANRECLKKVCENIQNASGDEGVVDAVAQFDALPLTTKWKTFAFLVPGKIPVIDSTIVALYCGASLTNSHYAEAARSLLRDYRDRQWSRLLNRVHARLGQSLRSRLGTLRIMDILLWTYATQVRGMGQS